MKDGRLEFEKALEIAPHIESDFVRIIDSYSTPLVSPNFVEPLKTSHGCGTFAMIKGRYGILTAAHVVQDILFRREDLLIYIPFQDKLWPITYNQIIWLPYIKGIESIDLAFIVLDNEKTIINFGKSFLPLIIEDQIIEEDKFLKMHCGFYAAPGQDKHVTTSEDKKTLNYDLSGVYLGNPDIGSYSKKSFYFPITSPEALQNHEIKFDGFLVSFEKWQSIPNSYKGTSGSGFFGAELVIDENNNIRLVNIKLLGVVVNEIEILRKLDVRGPISLYKTFLKFCSVVLETDDVAQAFEAIFTNESG